MAALPSPAVLTASGSYDVPNLIPGKEYLLTFKGNFGGATVTLQTRNDALGTFTAVDDAAWDGSGSSPTEARYVAPSTVSRLVVSNAGGSTAIGVTHLAVR